MVWRWGAATFGCERGKRLGGRLSFTAIVAPFRYMVEAAAETSSLLQYHMALHARVLPRRQTQMESYRTHTTNRGFVMTARGVRQSDGQGATVASVRWCQCQRKERGLLTSARRSCQIIVPRFLTGQQQH